MSMRDLPGQGGMVLLEYAGSNSGDETWSNADKGTGRTYVFGGVRKVGYVEAADAAWMLAIRANGRAIFQRAAPPPKPAAALRAVAIPRPVAPRAVEMAAPTPLPIIQEFGKRTVHVNPPGQEPRVVITAEVIALHDEDFGEAPAPETPGPDSGQVTDLLSLSVRDLKVILAENTYAPATLKAVLAQEKRATARKLLEAALA